MFGASEAQPVRWQSIQKTIFTGDADTVYFAFRPVGVFSSAVDPDTSAIDPPDQVYYDGDGLVTLRFIGGDETDSTISYAKAFDHNGRIFQDDSLMLFGAAFEAPGTGNLFGDGNLRGTSIADLPKFINGILIITQIFDAVGDSSIYEFGLGSH